MPHGRPNPKDDRNKEERAPGGAREGGIRDFILSRKTTAAARKPDQMEELTSMVKLLVQSQAAREEQVEKVTTRQEQRSRSTSFSGFMHK